MRGDGEGSGSVSNPGRRASDFKKKCAEHRLTLSRAAGSGTDHGFDDMEAAGVLEETNFVRWGRRARGARPGRAGGAGLRDVDIVRHFDPVRPSREGGCSPVAVSS